ncbi:prolyl 4-hydroxylase subunit alpha-1 [Sinocyclocheilus anshuiensis]|uniref:prolyl 4-hydroxylase subunit alpha-1 n=1 Tax=Sinocyclocheilus anshuiensis TaxID=1608454 RepID=UPI0007B8AC65|nr:PREDICTED: prolyl 4-hydroxylase subunit alpha-1-like [Sinocyclocheilus anshuiensis]
MALKELTFILVVCSWIVCTNGDEFFTSTDKMSQLFEEEEFLLKTFSLYIDAEEENVKIMKRLLLLLQLGLYLDPVDPEKIKDPVAAYKLLRRVRAEWKNIVDYTQQSLYQLYQTVLTYAQIPQPEDLDGAASGLIRLQEIYKLYPHNITKEISLNADEAYHVGFVAYNEHKFQHAFLWFLYSLDRLTQYSNTTKEKLLLYLSLSAYRFGSLPVAIYFGQQLLNLDPTNDEVKVLLGLYRRLRLQRTSNPDIFRLNNESSKYETLCRGEVDERTSKRQRALSCRYSTGGGNPRLIYAPVKEEVEWDEPGIIRYHDIISDREIEILTNISRPLLSRSLTTGGVSKNRTSQGVFLKEDNIVVARISQRIADITGLSTKSAENLFVQNYGIGGRYEPHYDELDDENGRIATFLIYMSDVEIGGATVFPQVDVALKPKKGSAVFWYNLHKNGNVDLNTKHAGCPVLRGNKWVANKWIHEFGQEFRRRCSLSYWE